MDMVVLMEIKTLDFESSFAEIERKIAELERFSRDEDVDFSAELNRLRQKSASLMEEAYSQLTPLQIMQVARHPQRPMFLDYVKLMCDDFVELHGDRQFSDDQAVVTGIASLDGHKVVLIGQQRGRDTKENLVRNFGMMRPEGYRKALRFMKFAEKFQKPILTFIDTMGAYPGLEAEERGQGEAIARNLREMSSLQIPIIVTVIGEGGSGGALGIGIGDRILMLQNAIYSVISPEGCASILWRDATKADVAAQALKITAPDLKRLGVIDDIVPEPPGGAHRNHEATASNLKQKLLTHLNELKRQPPHRLVERRHEKFRKMGPIQEGSN